jgi:DNA-binding CsgD family transcriptional regulator
MQQQNSIELIQRFCNNISYSFAIIANSKKIEYYNESFISYAQILTKESDIDMVFSSLTGILEDTVNAPLDSLIRPMTIDLGNCKIIITPNTLVYGDYVKRYLFLTIFERDEDEIEDQKDVDKPKFSVYSLSLLKQYNLTKRELEILQLMMEGYSNQQIADIQYISIFTVKTHNKNIFRKLKVSTRMEAVAKLKELQ